MKEADITSLWHFVEANFTLAIGGSLVSKVFLLDTNRKPLDPIHPGYARQLLGWGKAAVFRRFPFTLVLKGEVAKKEVEPEPKAQPLRLKLDPGSKTTGLALVNDTTGDVVFAAELQHRGQQIRDALLSRRQIRRKRRQRKTRYRPARFLNRRRPAGWLPPSLESRITNVMTWVKRLGRYCPIGAVSLELVRFDTQLIQNPEISGVEYQQGELAGYEVREYLLEKWQRTCAYCGLTGVPLEIEHIVPRSRGGSDRVSNLALACERCNQCKGAQTAAEFGYPHLQVQAKLPLTDAAAANSTRWALYRRLKALRLPIETGSGGLTKYNRTIRKLPKTHWIDAACVGFSTPAQLLTSEVRPLLIKGTGHGNRQMCGTNKYGFPIRHRARTKSYRGFRTGDLVKAVIPAPAGAKAKAGKSAGSRTRTGRITIRQRPSFRLNGFDVHPKYCRLLQRADGYAYQLEPQA